LSHGERTSITRDQVWSSLRGHRRLARTARERILERQISEDAQVEQDEPLTRNTGADAQRYLPLSIHSEVDTLEDLLCWSIYSEVDILEYLL
jgi:hypothetical protein